MVATLAPVSAAAGSATTNAVSDNVIPMREGPLERAFGREWAASRLPRSALSASGAARHRKSAAYSSRARRKPLACSPVIVSTIGQAAVMRCPASESLAWARIAIESSVRPPPPRKRLLTPRQPTCVAWAVDEDGWASLGQVAAWPRGYAGRSVDARRQRSAAAAPSDRVGWDCSRLGAVGQVESGVDGARRRALRKNVVVQHGPPPWALRVS